MREVLEFGSLKYLAVVFRNKQRLANDAELLSLSNNQSPMQRVYLLCCVTITWLCGTQRMSDISLLVTLTLDKCSWLRTKRPAISYLLTGKENLEMLRLNTDPVSDSTL
jgi:hypothetical protein